MKLKIYLLKDLMNFNGIFRKYVAYDNTKRHKKVGNHLRS